MSNSDWLTIPGEEVWETIKDRVESCIKEHGDDMDQDDIENAVERHVENIIEDQIHSVMEYQYEILDDDDVINIIASQWRDDEYVDYVVDIMRANSDVDMQEVEKLIDARHGEDTATSTELYEQVQDLTKKVDQMQKTISVIVSSMASVVAFVHQGE